MTASPQLRMARKVADIFATVWLILIFGGALISFVNEKIRTAAFAWMLILSFPSSFLTFHFNVGPPTGLLIMAFLGFVQWALIGYLLGFVIGMVRKALDGQ